MTTASRPGPGGTPWRGSAVTRAGRYGPIIPASVPCDWPLVEEVSRA